MTLIEVLIASGVVTIMMMAAAASFTGNLKAVGTAKHLTSGSIFLETVHEDLVAQDYGNLLALNGNRLFDGETEATSEYRVELDVSLMQVGLIMVRASLFEIASGTQLTRLVFLRSDS